MIYAGTVIGAGFASGQELSQYFLKYGKEGVFGILLSIVLFTFLAAIVLCKISVVKAENVAQYFGNGFISKVYLLLSAAFMFITFCTMVTATGEMFEEHLGLPDIAGMAVMWLLCIIALKKGEKGTVAVNKFMTPLIIVITLGVFVYTFFTDTRHTFATEKLIYNYATSAFVYVSYNTLGIIAVFTSVSNLVKNKTTAVFAAITGGFFLLVTSLCLWYILYTADFGSAKIPVLSSLEGGCRALYMPVLFCAMATTAVSCGFAVIRSAGVNENIIIIGLIVSSYIVSRMGFERLVADVYAFFGYLGFLVGAYTIIDGIKFLNR